MLEAPMSSKILTGLGRVFFPLIMPRIWYGRQSKDVSAKKIFDRFVK